MNFILFGIIFEILLLVGVLFWIRKQNSKRTKQSSLSKETIKNLKFGNFDSDN